jgi:hypothetical protein
MHATMLTWRTCTITEKFVRLPPDQLKIDQGMKAQQDFLLQERMPRLSGISLQQAGSFSDAFEAHARHSTNKI